MTLFLYASLSDSLRVLRQVRSSCRLIPLSLWRFEVNQGLEVRDGTFTVYRGAYLSSINDILELKWPISESRLKLSILEKALDTSWLKSVKLILLIER